MRENKEKTLGWCPGKAKHKMIALVQSIMCADSQELFTLSLPFGDRAL